jgi:acetyl-CoA carboxylase carboxyltransferase component
MRAILGPLDRPVKRTGHSARGGHVVTWDPELGDLRRRRALAHEMGGPEKVKKHRDLGKLPVRERIDALLDPGTFHEIGGLTGRGTYDEGELTALTPANFVMGRGRIDGRTVVVGGDDFTVRGGAADASIFQKQVHAERMAHDLGLPLVRLVDGSGGGGSVKTLETERRAFVPFNPGWEWVVANLARVPVVSLCLGSVAGLGAARVVTSHYSMMVKDTSHLFVAGPVVVNQLGTETVDKESLGGSRIHTRNGTVDDEVESEWEAFARARRFLSYLPSCVDELPPRGETSDDPERRDPTLIDAIPRERRKVYKVRSIIESVVDRESFFEIGRGWGRSAVTGLARLDGWPVAVLANDPYHYAGGWTADASRKVERFVDLAETFRLPVVHLVDNPGFLIGSASEQAGTIRHGARALAAVYQATVPWCSVLLRKVYGVAGAAHQNASRCSYRFAWPSGEWGSLPLEGGIEAAYRAQLEAAEDPAALRAEIEARLARARNPFKTAEAFMIEEIVDPRDTRPLLCEFANLAAPRRAGSASAPAARPRP